MKQQRIFVLLLCAILILNLSVPAFAAEPFGRNDQNNYTHGSSTIVEKEDLITDIPEDYDVDSALQAKAEEGLYSCLFDKTMIQDMKIQIPEVNWNYLLQNANENPTVLTETITIGDQSIGYAGIKTKGNLTLSSVWRSDSDRFSFTINFGKYIKKKAGYSDTQNFYGLSKVALNNIYGDSTLMKEYLSYELMTKMGVPTPEYCLVNLYINDEFWGVYMMVESIQTGLTQRTLGVKTDYLVKPESSGGDLIYNDTLDVYYDEETDTFDFTELIYPNGIEEGIVYPTEQANPLTAYAGLWENDEDTFEEVIEVLPTVFSWIRKLNELNQTDPSTTDYCQRVEEILNADAILRYFAVNTYLVNLDSYQSEKMQNYALCIDKNGYANILPWDYNYSFGAYGVGTAEAMVNFSVTDPVIDITLEERPLLNVLLQNESYRNQFNQYLRDCCIIASVGGTTSDGENYVKNNFATIIENYSPILEISYQNDPTAFYTISQYLTAKENLSELIALRSTAVLQQLDGNMETVSTTLDLSSMGDAIGGGMDKGNMGMFQEAVTLTDSTTGISVTGLFQNGASLTVKEVTKKDESYPTGLTGGYKHHVFYIAADAGITDIPGMSNASMDFLKQMPENGGAMPEEREKISGMDNNQNGRNQMPFPDKTGNGQSFDNFEENTRFTEMSYTISFPVDSEDAVVALLNDDGTLTTLVGTIQNGTITVTTASLGIFIVSNVNKVSSGIISLICLIVGMGVGAAIVGIAFRHREHKRTHSYSATNVTIDAEYNETD